MSFLDSIRDKISQVGQGLKESPMSPWSLGDKLKTNFSDLIHDPDILKGATTVGAGIEHVGSEMSKGYSSFIDRVPFVAPPIKSANKFIGDLIGEGVVGGYGRTLRSFGEKGPEEFVSGIKDVPSQFKEKGFLDTVSGQEFEDVTNLMDFAPMGALLGGTFDVTSKGLKSMDDAGKALLKSGAKNVDRIGNIIDDLSKSGKLLKTESKLMDVGRSIKGVFQSFGDAGKKIAGALDDFENEVAVQAKTAFTKFNDVYKGLKDVTSKAPVPKGYSDDKQIVNHILDLYHNRQPITLTPSQQKVATSFFEDVTRIPSELANKLDLLPPGVEGAAPRPFIPLIPDDIAKFKAAHLERLKKAGYAVEEAKRIINGALDKDLGSRVFKGFETQRFFEPQTYDDLVKYGYNTDLLDIVQKWSRGAWRRITAVRNFGGKEYEGIAKVIANMQEAGLSNKAAKELSKLFKLGVNGREMLDESIEAPIDVMKKWSALKLSLRSGLKQPQTLAQTSAVAGVKNTIKGVMNSFAKGRGINNDILKNTQILLSDGYKKAFVAPVSGMSSGFMNRLMDTVTNIKVKATGVPILDGAARRMSAVAAVEWIQQSIKKLNSGTMSPKARAKLVDQLNRFAFPNPNEIERLAKTGKATDHQISKAVQQFIKETQGGVTKLNLPAVASSSPFGELAFSLRTFSYEQARFVSQLVSMAKKGNVKPLITYIGTSLGIGTAALYTSDLVTEIIDGVKRKDERGAKEFVLEIMGQQLMGIAYDSLRNLSYDAYSPASKGALYGNLLGPAGGNIAEAGATALDVGERIVGDEPRKFEPALKLLSKWLIKEPIPVVGPRIHNTLFPQRSYGGAGQFLPK